MKSRKLIFNWHGKNYFCHCCSSIHMLQTTMNRPPSLTLTGARIFKQRLATIREHRIRKRGTHKLVSTAVQCVWPS